MTDRKDIEVEEDDTIVFADEEGNEIEFTEIAYFEYEGKNYSALVPVEPSENAEEEGEELVFCEVTEDAEGYENFNMIDDEELIDKLFGEFMKLQSECGCGCGCGCDDDCECD